jgi:hypothetical protein
MRQSPWTEPGMFGPAACRLRSAELARGPCTVRSPVVQRSAHDSGCRLQGTEPRCPSTWCIYQRRRPAGPKVQRHDGAAAGPARSAARGPACSSTAHGPARSPARASPKKPSRSRPVVRPGWHYGLFGPAACSVQRHVGSGPGCSVKRYVGSGLPSPAPSRAVVGP